MYTCLALSDKLFHTAFSLASDLLTAGSTCAIVDTCIRSDTRCDSLPLSLTQPRTISSTLWIVRIRKAFFSSMPFCISLIESSPTPISFAIRYKRLVVEARSITSSFSGFMYFHLSLM